MKKDVHPHIRYEWKILKEAENVEKSKPGNVGEEMLDILKSHTEDCVGFNILSS